MVYYKIPLTGGLDFPAGCILVCAYTYGGYEYCKFERVTEVGSNWASITESEFNVRCPDFPEPATPPAQEIIATSAEVAGGSIVLTLPRAVDTGTLVKFSAPCACSAVTGGIVIDGTTYAVVDAAGNSANKIVGAWEPGALVAVLIDTASNKAYIQNASEKKYVDDLFAKALPLEGGTMTGAINMGGKKISNLATPTANTDAATKAYADKMLPKAGGTMTGTLTVKGIKLTSGVDYGTTLPTDNSSSTKGRIFFKKVSS